MRDALLDLLPEAHPTARRAKTKMVGVNENGCRVGEYHGRAKVSDHEVELIRELYEDHGLSVRAIAEKFELSKSVVGRIVRYEARVSIPVNFRMVKEEQAMDHQEKMRTKQKIRDAYYQNHATPMEGVAAGINRRTGLPHVSAREIERNARRAK